jgi:hypothetical protein
MSCDDSRDASSGKELPEVLPATACQSPRRKNHQGGVAFASACALSFASRSTSGNSANEGGGIYNAKSAKLVIQSSDVVDNTAFPGADLYTFSPVKISKDSKVGVIGP